MAQILPYQFEPEFDSDEEVESNIPLEESHEADNSLEEAIHETKRVGKDSSVWCMCSFCSPMPTEKESVCCKEQGFLLKMTEGIKCITEHESFEVVCLNRDVIWTALVSIHDRESAALPERNNVSNRSYRYASYRQFTWWVHGWLGKRIRRVIPSCVINKIRSSFPEENNEYTGYKPGDDDDDSERDEELFQAWRDFLHL